MQGDNNVTKLVVRSGAVQIKVEVIPFLRGTVYDPELRRVAPSVEDAYGFDELPVVSFADLYAGKIVAAMDRQHPRDLFMSATSSPMRAWTTSRAFGRRRRPSDGDIYSHLGGGE